MTKRRALGKGLSSLIPEAPPEDGRAGVLRIDVNRVRPNPRQPRRAFDPEGLAELGASIKTHGLLQPVVVRRDGGDYELILGERRWRAAVAAGIRYIPALVRDVDERQRLEAALVENLQRQDLNPMEEARACHVLLEDFGLTHVELARRLGKSRPRISNILRILELDSEIRSRIEAGELSLGHAKALAGIRDPADQRQLAAAIVKDGWSVRRAEEMAADLVPMAGPGRSDSPKPKKSNELRLDPNVRDAEERLKRALGASVRIRGRGRKGRIEIQFSGLDELQRLFELLESAARAAPVPPPAEGHQVPLPGSHPDPTEHVG